MGWIVRLPCAAFAAIAIASAVPALAAPPPLEAYAKLPHIEMMQLSPSGNQMAFIAVDGDQRRLFVRDLKQGATLMAPKVGSTKVRSVRWAGDDLLVVIVGD